MAIEQDNDAERSDRIDTILRQIRETQTRVEQRVAEGKARAEQIAAERRDAQPLPRHVVR